MKYDRTGSGKAMEALLGPKTAMKNSKIPKLLEKSKIGIFVFSQGMASYFPGGCPPISPSAPEALEVATTLTKNVQTDT